MSSPSGYLMSPWASEDGGPARMQCSDNFRSLNITENDSLQCTIRNTFPMLTTMTVLGDEGEVYLLTHSAIGFRIGLPTSSQVEKIDPITLRTIYRSKRLPGGPFWPGGMAIHKNTSLYVVYGRYAHRLSRTCELLSSMKLPMCEPYNSFVILDCGVIVTKNISEDACACISVLDPTLNRATIDDKDIICPEPSIARLSSQGNTLYIVGIRSIFRYHWDATSQELCIDTTWSFMYISESIATSQSYGWDVVLDGKNAWFMDNGKHNYCHSMIGAGVSETANRLIRVSMGDSDDHEIVDVCGILGGAVTNPPLFDVTRSIVVAFDSANCHIRAWRYEERDVCQQFDTSSSSSSTSSSSPSSTLSPSSSTSSTSTTSSSSSRLSPLWFKATFSIASHMILFPDSGELVVNDYRNFGEEIVILDITTGLEKRRVRVGGVFQGVVFPSVGFNRDLYWSSFGQLARVYVEST